MRPRYPPQNGKNNYSVDPCSIKDLPPDAKYVTATPAIPRRKNSGYKNHNSQNNGMSCCAGTECCLKSAPYFVPDPLCKRNVDPSGPCCKCYRECNSPCKRMKGRFAIAFLAESPCLNCPPKSFEVEICDTPSRIEYECCRLMEWANCIPVQQRHEHKCCCCNCCEGHCTYLIKKKHEC